jgi:mannose-6-phosphate isomerase-like protein (cupin superfamily)
MFVIDNSHQPEATLPGIRHKTLAGSEQGLRHLSIWRQEIAGGQATPPHRHDCEEVVLVQTGQGELHIAGRVFSFGPETTLVIPPNMDHQIINTGAEPVRLTAAFSTSPVQVFLPDGQALPMPWPS